MDGLYDRGCNADLWRKDRLYKSGAGTVAYSSGIK